MTGPKRQGRTPGVTASLPAPDIAVPSRRRALYEATRDVHDAAEVAWSNGQFVAQRDVYRAYLRSMLGVHAGLGLRAESCAQVMSDGPRAEPARIAALRADLGLDPFGAEVCDEEPVSPDWAWGVRYALNGSALGASIMLKSGGVPGGWPRAYLSEMRSYATSGRLAGFFAQLDGASVALPEAVQGAREVFSALLASGDATLAAPAV